MAQTPTPRIATPVNMCTIQVGTTGTIGSLMTWELESMKQQHVNKPAATPPLQGSTPRLKHQSPPVSVPCGASPRRVQTRRSPANEPSTSHRRTTPGGRRSSTADTAAVQNILVDAADPPKTRQTLRKNAAASRISTILSSSAGRMDRDGSHVIKERPEKKGRQHHRHSFLVEVVDLKCNNPMSSRLKKLGFSKLSETIA